MGELNLKQIKNFEEIEEVRYISKETRWIAYILIIFTIIFTIICFVLYFIRNKIFNVHSTSVVNNTENVQENQNLNDGGVMYQAIPLQVSPNIHM